MLNKFEPHGHQTITKRSYGISLPIAVESGHKILR